MISESTIIATAWKDIGILRYIIIIILPSPDYHQNTSKTWLILKEGKLKETLTLFQRTGVSSTEEGKRHLGAAVSTTSFVVSYICPMQRFWMGS